MIRGFCKSHSSRRGLITSIGWPMHWGLGETKMNADFLKRLTRIVFFVLAVPTVAWAQDDEVVKVKSNLVNIDVIVKDKKGKYISDLKAEDFVITENGQPQKIEFFDAPLAHGETRKTG